MNDKQLSTFISVVESGSFSSAARKQYISPQAMLQQIDLLEKEVGVPLLLRSTRGVKLTSAGKLFYEGVLSIQNEMNQLLHTIHTNAEANQYTLRLGSYLTQPLNQLCETFSSRYPHVVVQYTLLPTQSGLNNLDLIRNDQLDIIEQFEIPEVYQDNLDCTPIISSSCICVLSPSHPLASRNVLYPCDLADLSVALHAESYVCGLRELLQNKAPNSTLVNRTQGVTSALQHCSNGGIFLVADCFSEKYKPLRLIPLECDLRWNLSLVHKKHPPSHVRLFIEHAKAQYPL